MQLRGGVYGDTMSNSGNTLREREYVDDCPNCETQFVAVSPDEFREEHAPKCNPILKLLRFTGGNQ